LKRVTGNAASAERTRRFVVEIRNKAWLDQPLVSVLREHKVALALTDHGWMPRSWEVKKELDLITVDFAYVRWLGDRKGTLRRLRRGGTKRWWTGGTICCIGWRCFANCGGGIYRCMRMRTTTTLKTGRVQ